MKRVVACLVLALAAAGCGGEPGESFTCAELGLELNRLYCGGEDGEDGESFDCAALFVQLNRLERQLDDLKASERSEKNTARYFDDMIERGWTSEDSRHDPAKLRTIQEEIRLLESDIRLIEADFRAYGCT